MDLSDIKTHLAQLAQQTPPIKQRVTAREGVAKCYDEIIDLVTQGWPWDDIAQGFQGKNGPIKGTTLRKYFYERQRSLEEQKQNRRAKRKKAPAEQPQPEDKPDPRSNMTFYELANS